MDITNSLYRVNEDINRILALNMTEEGEINDAAWEQIEALQITKQELQHSLVNKYKEMDAFLDAVEKERKRIVELKRVTENALGYMRKRIGKEFPDGEKNEKFVVSKRKSESLVVDDALLNLRYIKEYYPEAGIVVEDLKLDKAKAKAFIKETGVEIQGLSIKENTNWSVK